MRNRCAQSAFTQRVVFVTGFVNEIFKRIEIYVNIRWQLQPKQSRRFTNPTCHMNTNRHSKKQDNWLENLFVNKTGGGERRNSRFGEAGSRTRIRLARREKRCRTDEKQVRHGLFLSLQTSKNRRNDGEKWESHGFQPCNCLSLLLLDAEDFYLRECCYLMSPQRAALSTRPQIQLFRQLSTVSQNEVNRLHTSTLFVHRLFV